MRLLETVIVVNCISVILSHIRDYTNVLNMKNSCFFSEVIRGLVFKKNTAHKHMPTKCKNPGLLLLRGVLGHREVGLSSFDSMKQACLYRT